jgi:mRNA interferase MazF
MSSYRQGDVILAPVPFKERGGAKTRPAVVVFASARGDIYACPVSSKPPSDAPAIPIALDDFATGGLDLFSESYVLTSRVSIIRSGEVIGKRGQLTDECTRHIVAMVPPARLPDNRQKSPNPRSRPSQ